MIIIGIVAAVFFATLLFAILMVSFKLVQKFYCIKKIIEKDDDSKKIKKRKIIINTVVFVILGIFSYISFVNTLIVVLHVIIIVALVELVGRIVNKFKSINTKYYWQGIVGLIIAAIYLSIGAYNDFTIRRTDYKLKTEKQLGTKKLRIVQISDSHIGTTFDGEGFAKELKKIQKTNPDIVLITGDYVDDGTTKKDMLISNKALGEMKTKYGIYLIYGNHDKGYYNYRNFTTQEMAADLEKNNVKVLKDETVLVNNSFYIIGRRDKSMPERKSAADMVKGLDKSKYMIMLDHQPSDYENEVKTQVDLVLSGHTHGGQMFPIGFTGELTGVNDKTYGLEKRDKTTFIVNSGISDWEIIFKTGTYSEYGVIDVTTLK